VREEKIKGIMISTVFQGVFDTSYDIAFRDRLPTFGTGCTKITKGYIDPVNDRIVIRRGLAAEDRALTLLHEIVHDCYPDWSEEDVEACAQFVYERLSKHDRGIVQFLATDPEAAADERR
jgi:hypothetical protein